jgi:hypothetical protein
MNIRAAVCLLCVVVIASFLVSCHAYKDTDLQISPTTANVGPTGSTVQFTALEVSTDAGHPSKTRDVTKTVT